MIELNVSEILKPESDLEKTIVSNQEFVIGCLYGKPRSGHPEGQVIYHIAEVLKNINKYSDFTNRADLRLVGLIHDTFKYKVYTDIPKTGENHHGMIARRFAERFISTARVLETIELHDEAYNSWRKLALNRFKAERRANELISRLGKDIDFYLTFFRCDNETGDKSHENYDWFADLERTRVKIKS